MIRRGLFSLIVLVVLATVAKPSLLAGRQENQGGCWLSAATELDAINGISASIDSDGNWNDYLKQTSVRAGREFGVSVPMLSFDDEGAPNALFSTSRWDRIGRAAGIDPKNFHDRGIVLIGRRLIREEHKAGHDFAIPAIIAHEYAHAMQFKQNCPLRGKLRELHADYMAGWYTQRTNKLVDLQSFERILQAYNSFEAKGDFEFFSPAHHGAPVERSFAFILGQGSPSKDAAKAYEDGINAITKRLPDLVRQWLFFKVLTDR